MATLADLSKKLKKVFEDETITPVVKRERVNAAPSKIDTLKTQAWSPLAAAQRGINSYHKGIDTVGKWIEPLEKRTTRPLIGQPLEAIAISRMSDAKKAAYKPVALTAPTVRGQIMDVGRGAVNTAATAYGGGTGAGLKMLGGLAGFNTLVKGATMDRKQGESMLGAGLRQTGKDLPELIPRAGTYAASAGLTNPLLKGASFIKKGVALGAANVAEDQVTKSTGLTPDLTKSDMLVSFLAPIGLEAAGKALSSVFGKAIPKALRSSGAESVVDRYGDIIKVKTKAGQTIFYDTKKSRIVTAPMIKKTIERDVPFNYQGKEQVPIKLRQETIEPAFGALGGLQPEMDEDGKLSVGYDPMGGLAGVAMVGGLKAKNRGFTDSIKDTPNVSGATKEGVRGSYKPKSNAQLIEEAKALLNEGATIDFKNIKDVDKKVAAVMQEAINMDAAGDHKAAANLFNNLSEQGTELGRGVQAFSLLEKMSPEAISLSAAGKIKKYNRTASKKIPELDGEKQKLLSEFVEKIRSTPDGREKNILIHELNDRINSFIPSSLSDKILTVWKAGLLTSLRTHERNLLGNTVMSAAEIAKDPIASVADALLSMSTGKRTQTSTLRGIGEATSKDTAQQVSDLLKRGFDPNQDISKFDVKKINWANTPIQQSLKAYTDLVFRTLSTEDRPFWNAAFARSLYDQAGAAAKNGNDPKLIRSLVDNPTEEMLTTATKDANYTTFHDKNKLTELASAVKRKAGEAWYTQLPAEVILPFTGVPSSVVGKTFAYSPLGLIKGAISAGRVVTGQVPEMQRQAAQEIGRGVLGTGLFALGAYLMERGLMTGQPKDSTESAQWELEGKPSNSILIGGKWRRIGSVGPQSLVTLAGAKYQEEMSDPEGSIGSYLAGLGKDQLQQTFLAGIQQPLNAITDPARYGTSYVGNLASSVVPNIVKDSARSSDPIFRETNTAADYVKNSIPGVRNTLPPKRDVLGNIIAQEPTGLGAFVDLFGSKTPKSSSVIDELSRLNSVGANATPSKLGKSQTIGGTKYKLTPEELNTLEEGVGNVLRSRLDELINSDGYRNLTDEDKANAIDNVVAAARKQVRGTINLTGSERLTSEDNAYTLINPETGAVRRIDIEGAIAYPQLSDSGTSPLDKKLISRYKSKITSRINDIVALYEDGQLSEDEANRRVADLQKQATGGSKAKKGIRVSMPKVSTRSTIKIRAASRPRSSTKLNIKKLPKAAIKLTKPKSIKITSKTYAKAKPIKFKNTLGGDLTKLG